MKKTSRTSSTNETEEDVDPAITRYETMPLEQVRAELKKAGIDTDATVRAVKALVSEAFRGRSLHETLVAFFGSFLSMSFAVARAS
jgi:hypothetical protein